jgi:hypothetical protein
MLKITGSSMESWQCGLNGDPIPWLLEPENPSIRFWTLVEILGLPHQSEEVQDARASIPQQSLVKELFNLQHPEGYWGDDQTRPYTAFGAVTALALLYMFGVSPDQRTEVGCDSLLKNCQNACGGFSLNKTLRSGIFPCTTGQHLPMLVYFGFEHDPRVQFAFTFMIQGFSLDDALDCGRYQHRDCLWGAIAALNGLAVLPADMRSAQSELVIKRLANILLDADYDFEGEHRRWLTFGVPRSWDLLSAIKVLAIHGYSGDARFNPLLQKVLNLQDAYGRWNCASVSRSWPIEKRNKPSKWVTLDILRVLKIVNLPAA